VFIVDHSQRVTAAWLWRLQRFEQAPPCTRAHNGGDNNVVDPRFSYGRTSPLWRRPLCGHRRDPVNRNRGWWTCKWVLYLPITLLSKWRPRTGGCEGISIILLEPQWFFSKLYPGPVRGWVAGAVAKGPGLQKKVHCVSVVVSSYLCFTNMNRANNQPK
jgi:hypothetical protein